MMRFVVCSLVWASSSSAFAQPDRRALETNRVTIECDRAPIEQVVDRFREASGVTIRIDATVRERLSADDLRVTFRGRDLTVRTALQGVLAPKELAAVWTGDAVRILPRASLFETRVYDVRDLLVVVRDFVPPPLGFAAGRAFAIEEPPETRGDPGILELVRTHTGGRSWSGDGAASLVDGLLIVTQRAAAHREIRDLLAKLRERR